VKQEEEVMGRLTKAEQEGLVRICEKLEAVE